MGRIKVLLIAPKEEMGLTGGQARAASILADGLALRDDVDLFHIRVPHRQQATSVQQAIALRIEFYLRVITALAQHWPDIIHVFSPCSLPGLCEKMLVTRLASLTRSRTLLNFRNDPHRFFKEAGSLQRVLITLCVRRFDAILCQFRALEELFVDSFRVEHSRVYVAYNAVSSATFCLQPAVISQRYECARVIYLGSLEERKGLRVLFEAVKVVLREHDVFIDVVGDPQPESFLSTLTKHAQRLGIEKKVKFHGALFGRDKDEILESASLLVLPSTAEGFPNVVLEAGAVGVPAVLTDVGAAREIAEAFDVGAVVVPVDDYLALATAISSVLATKEGYCERARAAQAGIRSFTVESMCDAVVCAYQRTTE